MPPTDLPPSAPLQPDFNDVLAAALRLTRGDQARLANVLGALVGGGAAAPVGPAQAGPDQASQAPQQTVDEWLAEIAALPPRERVALIDDALERVDMADAPVLAAARRELFASQPTLAVRVAVETVFERAPVLGLIGVGGLLLALISAARGLFRVIF